MLYTFSFSCPDSPTHKFLISSFKKNALWPANEPATHFSNVLKPSHLQRIFDTASLLNEPSAWSIVARQGWLCFLNVAPGAYSRNLDWLSDQRKKDSQSHAPLSVQFRISIHVQQCAASVM
jgi:hypothetical protein